MEVVKFVFIAADGVHVSIKALSGEEAVALQGKALPLGQGLDDLGLVVGRMQDVKADRTFIAVEIVVQTGVLLHKQRSGDPVEVQQRTQPVFKEPVDQADGFLGIIHAEDAFIAFGNIDFHMLPVPFYSLRTAMIF